MSDSFRRHAARPGSRIAALVGQNIKYAMMLKKRGRTQALPVSKISACPHLGPVLEEGKGCGDVPIYSCAVFGKCTKTACSKVPNNCINCPEHPDRTGLPVIAQPTDVFRFDESGLIINCPTPRRFNSSIVRWQNGYAIATRVGWEHSDIWMERLDANFQPVGGAVKLDLEFEKAIDGRDDPQLFWFRNRLHVSFVGVDAAVDGVRTTSVCYAELTDDLAVKEIFYPHYEGRNAWEKNWGFFEYQNSLYAVYSIAPHRVLRIDGNKAEMAYESTLLANWTGGEMRGGAAPVRVGDEYWNFFHDRVPIDLAQWQYRTGLYTFEAKPPFKPLRIYPGALVEGHIPSKPAGWPVASWFVRGAVKAGDDWILSAGVHDRTTEIRKFSHADLSARLLRGRAPAWWSWRGEPQEEGMWASIHLNNEYRIANSEIAGRAVLDVGAHVGTFAARAAWAGATEIHCYEPDPASFRLLEKNVAELKKECGAQFHLFNEGVGAPGRGEVVAVSPESTSNTVVAAAGGSVNIISIDEAIARIGAPQIVLKLDCEGCEREALWGGKLPRVVKIVGEYHDVSPADVDRQLRVSHFKPSVSSPGDNGRTGNFSAVASPIRVSALPDAAPCASITWSRLKVFGPDALANPCNAPGGSSGSTSGSTSGGGPVETACCEVLVPQQLYCTVDIPDPSSDCAYWDGASFPLVYNSALRQWIGSIAYFTTGCVRTLTVTLLCNTDVDPVAFRITWEYEYSGSGCTDCLDTGSGSTDVSPVCDPILLSVEDVDLGPSCNCLADLTITE